MPVVPVVVVGENSKLYDKVEVSALWSNVKKCVYLVYAKKYFSSEGASNMCITRIWTPDELCYSKCTKHICNGMGVDCPMLYTARKRLEPGTGRPNPPTQSVPVGLINGV